jgi:hypothetical protein
VSVSNSLGLIDALFPVENLKEKAKEFLLMKILEKAPVKRPWTRGDFRSGHQRTFQRLGETGPLCWNQTMLQWAGFFTKSENSMPR